ARRMAARELAQDLMDDGAARGGIEFGAEWLQFLKLQNIAGENLVWLGDPALEPGHAQLARPRPDRWTRLWWLRRSKVGNLVALARPSHPRSLRRKRGFQPRGIDKGGQPLQPT